MRGPAGVGKTTLAEQCAWLFGRFGGRVLRMGPFGHLDPDDFLPQFHLALATAAGTSGVGFDRLRTSLAARIDAAGSPVLLLVDDVPAGVPPGVLDRVVLPSAWVRTLLTSRCARWTAAEVDVPGLPLEEGLRLLGSPDAGFVARCDGHPMTLRATASTLRERPGSSSDGLPDTAPQAIRDVVVRLDPAARAVLRLGGVLAPAPIPPEVARGEMAGDVFEAAVAELVEQGFATWVGADVRLQALAVEVACGEFGASAPEGAAEAVLRGLANGGVPPGHAQAVPDHAAGAASGEPPNGSAAPDHASTVEPAVSCGPAEAVAGGDSPPPFLGTAAGERHFLLLQHARVLAEHCPAHRVALLRPVAAAHEAHGDPVTAGEIHAAILATGEATSADFTAAPGSTSPAGWMPKPSGMRGKHSPSPATLPKPPSSRPRPSTAKATTPKPTAPSGSPTSPPPPNSDTSPRKPAGSAGARKTPSPFSNPRSPTPARSGKR